MVADQKFELIVIEPKRVDVAKVRGVFLEREVSLGAEAEKKDSGAVGEGGVDFGGEKRALHLPGEAGFFRHWGHRTEKAGVQSAGKMDQRERARGRRGGVARALGLKEWFVLNTCFPMSA